MSFNIKIHDVSDIIVSWFDKKNALKIKHISKIHKLSISSKFRAKTREISAP